MKNDLHLEHIQWASSLRILMQQVEFWSMCGDELWTDAMQAIEIAKIAEMFDQSPSHDGVPEVLAIQLVVPMLEKTLIDEVRKLKADKRFQDASVVNFRKFFKAVAHCLPAVPKVMSEYAEKRRAELLSEQAVAVVKLISYKKLEMGEEVVWPSTARSALLTLLEEPRTRFAGAFDTYAGAKLFVVQVQELLVQSPGDSVASLRVNEFFDAVQACKREQTAEKGMDGFRVTQKTLRSSIIGITDMLPKMGCSATEDSTVTLCQVR